MKTLLIYNTLTTQGIRSIDAFRGITIMLMIFVNYVSGIPPWMKRKAAHADVMIFVDALFSAFFYSRDVSFLCNQQPVKERRFFFESCRRIYSGEHGRVESGVYIPYQNNKKK